MKNRNGLLKWRPSGKEVKNCIQSIKEQIEKLKIMKINL